MARIVLASQVFILFRLDSAWTLKNMLGLFGWTADPRKAQQAWHGYLVWGSWDDDFLEHFLPCYVETFPHVHDRLGRFRPQFCEHMAAIALFSAVSPLDSWLKKFIRTVEPEDRATWASAIRPMLDSLPPEKKQSVWDLRLSPYWKARLNGSPPALTGEEVARMVGWALSLQPVFPDVVELILRSPAPHSLDSVLYLRMQKSGVSQRYPEESARLLKRLVTSESDLPSSSYTIRELTMELAERRAEKTVLDGICEKLADLGDPGAAELKAFVEQQCSPPK